MTEPQSPAPIIVTALFGDADFAVLDGLRRAYFPAARNQVPAHLTLFHHLPPSIGPELAQRLRDETRGVPPPRAQLAGLIDLGGGVALRLECPELADIRAGLADAFATLLTPQDRAGWRPHVTVQNKVSAEVARATRTTLAAGFRPRPVAIVGLASFHYRGGPWEPIGRYRFG
ncbi:MAG: hypothetical protein JWN59_616 [Sphingomonas bacterium]|nr:hypothetical protein [Sphingomonas bacterium]